MSKSARRRASLRSGGWLRWLNYRQMMICIDVAPGEALDRLSILHLKSSRLQGTRKGDAAEFQYARLAETCRPLFIIEAEAAERVRPAEKAYARLLDVNGRLWDVEERVRELLGTGGDEFARAAAQVPRLNDERCRVKAEFDARAGLDAHLSEVKSYLC